MKQISKNRMDEIIKEELIAFIEEKRKLESRNKLADEFVSKFFEAIEKNIPKNSPLYDKIYRNLCKTEKLLSRSSVLKENLDHVINAVMKRPSPQVCLEYFFKIMTDIKQISHDSIQIVSGKREANLYHIIYTLNGEEENQYFTAWIMSETENLENNNGLPVYYDTTKKGNLTIYPTEKSERVGDLRIYGE